jgi:uncharacterized protein YeaO (DUF488 family)
VPLKFRTVQIGSPRQAGEGLRIGAVRFLPRGVPKSEYAERNLFDLWLPILAPSRELLKAFRDEDVSPAKFFQRYRSEMAETDARQVIQLLAALAHQTPLSVWCWKQNTQSWVIARRTIARRQPMSWCRCWKAWAALCKFIRSTRSRESLSENGASPMPKSSIEHDRQSE